MKKLCLLLALMLALLPASSLAATLTDTILLPREVADSYEMLYSGQLFVRDYDIGYWLVNDQGEAVSPVYADIDNTTGQLMVTFSTTNTLNSIGLLDAITGEEFIPAKYGDVEILSEHWIAGVMLTPTTNPNAPYWGLGGGNYDYVQIDLYYDGELVTTIPKEECCSVHAYGDYVRGTTDANIWWIGVNGDKQVYERYSNYSYEFNNNRYENIVTHNGSGQQAFIASCTLTAEQIDSPFIEMAEGIVDLQGNVIVAADTLPEDCTLYSCSDDWLNLRCDDYETDTTTRAVMDCAGNLVIPFDTIELPSLNSSSTWFANGFLPALTADHHLRIYNTAGEITQDVLLPESIEDSSDIRGFSSTNTHFMYIEGETPMVISMTAGLLDVSAYDEVYYSYSNTSKLLLVKQNELWGCIDDSGELVVPCMFKYQPSINHDGTRVFGIVDDEELGYLSTLCIVEY